MVTERTVRSASEESCARVLSRSHRLNAMPCVRGFPIKLSSSSVCRHLRPRAHHHQPMVQGSFRV